MLGNLYYYLCSTGIVTGLVFGVYYVYDKQQASRLVYQTAFAGVRAYIVCRDYKDKILKFVAEKEDTPDNESGACVKPRQEDTLLYYKDKEQISYCTDNLQAERLSEETVDSALLVLKRVEKDGQVYHRRIDSVSDIKDATFNPVAKQFLQIELILTDKSGKQRTIDIHRHLGTFYVEGNRILDRDFLEWYVGYWYSTPLTDEYVLQIFDKDVNRFSLKNGECILLGSTGYSKRPVAALEEH
jgi:hypothetical protein